ncbi:MAG: hypothetical protein ACSLFN_13150 [Candidatus Limnocylindrales bacterium]
MLSRSFTPKRRGRRPLAVIAVIALVSGLVLAAGSALAVHDDEFQLDGDTTSAVAQNVPDSAVQVLDWNDLFNANGSNTSVINPNGGAGDFTAGSFKRDFRAKATRNGDCTAPAALTSSGLIFCTNDSTTFATGSKDILAISGWQCNRDNNVNSKIDIMNAYAAQYQDGTDRIMYFGLDKNVDNGNNNVAFWFLKDGTVDCDSAGGAVTFTGQHRDGDVLVVSAFTGGGGVSNIDAYRWDGTNNCIDNPSLAGVCDASPVASGGDCKDAATLDNICATTNSGPKEENDNITTKWPTADGTLGIGITVVPPNFFEGGINLTKVLGGAACFSTFVADTRSSQSLTATLFDFARGQLGGCTTTLTTKAGLSTTPITGEVASPASIGGGSVSSGTDTANIVITGSQTWAGTLSFYLCGPDANLTTCDPTKGVKVTETAVSNASPATAFVSGTATLTSAGKYCWFARFQPDQASAAAGIQPDDDQGGALECFTVAKVTPDLSTSAGPDVTLNQPVTDSATLVKAAKEPGSNGGNTNYPSINATNGAFAGTITFLLKGPSATGCGSTAAGTANTALSLNVTGNGSYGPVSFTTTQVGNFHWQATYANANSANNTAPVTHNANCDDTTEDVIVTGSAAFTTAQNWLPNDSATLTAPTGTTLNGTLTFTLYGTANCSGSSLYTESFTITAGAPAGTTRTTTNGSVPGTTYLATASGSYSWLVTYDDSSLNDPSNSCKEDTTLTLDNTTDPTP